VLLEEVEAERIVTVALTARPVGDWR
jgi:hypothetical protein